MDKVISYTNVRENLAQIMTEVLRRSHCCPYYTAQWSKLCSDF